MKKLMTIGLMAIVFAGVVSCKKTNSPPQNNIVNNNPNPNPGPTPVAMTQQDSMLCGYWVLDKHDHYYNSNLVSSTNHNDSANCFLELKSEEMQVGAVTAYRKANIALGCMTSPGNWRVNSGKLELGSLYTINSLSTNSLVIQIGSVGTEGHIYYLSK